MPSPGPRGAHACAKGSAHSYGYAWVCKHAAPCEQALSHFHTFTNSSHPPVLPARAARICKFARPLARMQVCAQTLPGVQMRAGTLDSYADTRAVALPCKSTQEHQHMCKYLWRHTDSCSC